MWERLREKCMYMQRAFRIELTHKRAQTGVVEDLNQNIIIALNLFVIRFAFDEHGYAPDVITESKAKQSQAKPSRVKTQQAL